VGNTAGRESSKGVRGRNNRRSGEFTSRLLKSRIIIKNYIMELIIDSPVIKKNTIIGKNISKMMILIALMIRLE
jgi:hypothetical protein